MGDATARSITFRSRLKDAYIYPNSAWVTPFIGGSYKFEQNGAVNLDAKNMFFFYATGVTPAMTLKMVRDGFAVMLVHLWTPRATLDGSNRTDCTCHPTFLRRISGHSRCTITRQGRCSRLINNLQPSVV